MSFDLNFTDFTNINATTGRSTFTGTYNNFGNNLNTNSSNLYTGLGGSYNATGYSATFNGGNNTDQLQYSYSGAASVGVNEVYVAADVVRNNAGSNNVFNQIFYTDTAGGFHASSVSSGSYNSTNNTFQVVVANGANNTGFNTGNLVVSNGNGFTTTATYSSQVASGGNQILTYQLGGAPTTSGTYHVYVNGYNVGARGIDSTPTLNVTAAAPAPTPVPCYVTGTRIRVLRGLTIADVPVERLAVGDLALTASGKPRPIRWIGTRAYPGLTAPKHDRPVRIRAGALAEGVPARDLLVSPDHCLFLDGLFVAAGHLSNGTSIVRGEAVQDLTYWHVELDSHDLLVAENTPAESFLAAPGVRAGFDGVGANDAAAAPVAYAPRAERHTPEMDALRERLIFRAGLSVEPMRFGAVRAWLDVCDGARVAGWAQDAAHPDAPVCLDIVVDGAVVAMALSQDHRADLAAAGMGDGRHGFDIALDEPLKRGVAHTVEVCRSADGLRVAAMAVDAAGTWTALLAA